MAPPRKVPAGSTTRSILLRLDQIAELEAEAEAIGVDLSDVVRGVVDLLFPADSATRWARTRAAVEVNRRWLAGLDGAVRDDLVRAVLDGWRGLEPRVPLRATGRAAAVRVGETIRMLRRLDPKPPKGAQEALGRWTALAADWAGRITAGNADVLDLLASPATRCLSWLDPKTRLPDVMVVAGVIADRGGPAAELGYKAPGAALARLLRDGGVGEKMPHKFVPFIPTAAAYWLDWKSLWSDRPPPSVQGAAGGV
jgi:hypothetical protein